MPKIFEVYNQAVNQGKDQGVLSADIRLLIAHDEGFAEPIDTLYHKDDEMAHIDLFNSQFAELLKGKPVEYILHGCAERRRAGSNGEFRRFWYSCHFH